MHKYISHPSTMNLLAYLLNHQSNLPSIHKSNHPFIHLPTLSYIHLSIYQLTLPSIHLSIHHPNLPFILPSVPPTDRFPSDFSNVLAYGDRYQPSISLPYPSVFTAFHRRPTVCSVSRQGATLLQSIRAGDNAAYSVASRPGSYQRCHSIKIKTQDGMMKNPRTPKVNHSHRTSETLKGLRDTQV